MGFTEGGFLGRFCDVYLLLEIDSIHITTLSSRSLYGGCHYTTFDLVWSSGKATFMGFLLLGMKYMCIKHGFLIIYRFLVMCEILDLGINSHVSDIFLQGFLGAPSSV